MKKMSKAEAAMKHGYRSGIEEQLSEFLRSRGIKFQYEVAKFKYNIPETKHTYTSDFSIDNKGLNGSVLILESKGTYRGRWPVADRAKHLHLRRDNPGLDIRFVFHKPQAKIAPGAKMSVAEWATKNGFTWCGISDIMILENWLGLGE